jgi:hypothetical protein
MSPFKPFLAWNTSVFFLAEKTSALGWGFPDQEQKIPGNHDIPEVFPARKS